MHEWALAEAVVAAAAETSRKDRIRVVREIRVRLGELQRIEKEVFALALREILAREGPTLCHAQAEIVVEKARLRCRVCSREWDAETLLATLIEDEAEAIHFIPEMALVFARCGGCGGFDFEIVQGRGVWLDHVTGSRMEPETHSTFDRWVR